jgi:hypothetical protein
MIIFLLTKTFSQMDIFTVFESILMGFGILFYGIFIFFFIFGKVKNIEEGSTDFAFGKLTLKANTFIIILIISAIFAFNPLIFDLLKKSGPASNNSAVEPGSPKISYQVSGNAIDLKGSPLKNIPIYGVHTKNERIIKSQVKKSLQNGEYDITFDSVELADNIEVFWEDPTGDTQTVSFSPKFAHHIIKIEHKN